MKALSYLASGIAALTLAACGGGGGSTSTGGTHFSHEELAREFVYRLNIDAGYDVELIKDNTLQYDYIVVYDYDLGTYDAYDLGNYNVGENLNYWLNNNDYKFYYDLIPIGFNEYEDYSTGIVFEKTAPTPKDRLKMAALEEGLMIKKAASTLSAQFGLSQERSAEVAKLAVVWQKTPKERMSDKDHDRFAKEILGHSLTEYKAAVEKKVSGSPSALKELIADTAKFNGVSPDQMNGIITGVFGEAAK